MIELDSSVHPELVPLSWLIGSWEGVGVVGYA
ncbi:MAG: FABP family protein, partial [Brevibacterium aurantiacum]|nr:FABP family protein [Brevibacterium aurantiacum]